ncbi:MAG: tetratricopeptide repeat protein [Xanthomonadales bacterium]|nr:tetratricopeptide repeat protein [Xanthomonadales bacterium]NIN58617.1 tetratricopeptide repeat protein [Xanthomonadales bacterium]NIN73906.1 tetratricopeptide repeat protein [Xanthomonadales bacterium]NIO12375.1 tetratricopeptide repeat protein [Xanthomonadales bacterium]NIP11010.1 tetratricopeptide repeat protein [Xanthomonadales bacterium]
MIFSALLLLSASGAAFAQEDSKRKTKQTVAMSQQVYEKLTEVQELVEAKNYAGGHAAIRDLQQRKGLTPYEVAQIWNLTGYTYYLEERYQQAINAYRNVLRQEELPEALQQSTLKTLAQLQFTVENYQGALQTIRELMALVPEPSADIYMLLGQAYFQMGNYREALEPIRTAVEMYKQQGRTPRENWLLLLRVCYYELGDFPSMIGVLKELITHYPKDTYILTLAGVYSELGDTKKQLALVEVLYEKGHVRNSSHLVNLANLYLLHETPYKAAVLLEKEIADKRVEKNVRNLRLLSQAWYTAREDRKAIPPLREAAEMSDDGELFVRLAQSHLNLEQWDEAARAIQRGLRLGGIDRSDTANIMLGMALFNQKKLDLARAAFEKAMTDRRSRRTAQQWISYVDSEKRRVELMEQELPTMQPRQLDDILKANPRSG